MAARFLSSQDNAIFRTLPNSQSLKAFFDFWTRKEAYCKAIGIGLAQLYDGVGMPPISEEPAQAFNIEENAREACRWSITSFAPAPKYTATLAVEGQDLDLHYFQFVPNIKCKHMCSNH